MPFEPPFAHEEHPLITNPSPPGNGSMPERIRSLDVLRGIAVLLALFTSIWIFGGFTESMRNGLSAQAKGLNYALYSTVSVLLEGKMLGLIAVVFGASMLLYLFGTPSGRVLRNADYYIRRQMWLIAFGFINAFLFLWTHDVLFHLGVMGVLTFAFIRLSPRLLLVAAIVTTLIYSGKVYWKYSDDKTTFSKYLAVITLEKKIKRDSAAMTVARARKGDTSKAALAKLPLLDTLTKKQQNEKKAWEGLVSNLKYDAKKDDETKKETRNTSYAKLWNGQLQTTEYREAEWTYRTGIWEIGSMIFLGMALFRFGFFTSRLKSAKYLLLAAVCLLLAFLAGWFRLHYYHLVVVDYAAYIRNRWVPYNFFYPFEIVLAVSGFTSLVVYLADVSLLRSFWKGFELCGRMALSNYLLQSILCLLFFTGFGLGYFGRLQQWQLYVFAAEIMLINVVFSYFWLRFYTYGPAEWLLRSLTLKSWIPNRINNTLEAPVAIS